MYIFPHVLSKLVILSRGGPTDPPPGCITSEKPGLGRVKIKKTFLGHFSVTDSQTQTHRLTHRQTDSRKGGVIALHVAGKKSSFLGHFCMTDILTTSNSQTESLTYIAAWRS